MSDVPQTIDSLLTDLQRTHFSDREFKAQLKAIIEAEIAGIIGEDEELFVPLPGIDNHNAVQRQAGGNTAREQARQRAAEAMERMFGGVK